MVAALLATGCGDDEPAAVRTEPAVVTPVPSSDAPVPTPSAEIHASPTPTPTATPAPKVTATPDTGGTEAEPGAEAGAGAGDEEAIEVRVAVTVRADRITLDPDVVAAFLPLRVRVRNTLDRRVTVVAMLGGGGAGVPIGAPAGETVSRRFPGLRAQTIRVMSPDLGPEASATLRVRAGG